jgi:large subunit ribosomal protein L29
MAKGLTAGELRTSTEDELTAKLREAKEELFNLRFQAATGQLESHGRLRGVRKEIARIYTVMRERELGIVTIADYEEAGQFVAAPAEEPEAPMAEEPEAPVAEEPGDAAADEEGDEEGEEPSRNE